MHVYDKRVGRGKRLIRRDSFRLGVLSPKSGIVHNGSVTLGEPSALLLTPDSVMVPYLDDVSRKEQTMHFLCSLVIYHSLCVIKSLKSTDAVLRWEENNIPPSYLSNNGYCRISALSSNGECIAVAANRGLCILDLSQRSQTSHTSHWKLFSRVKEEQSFRVLHMAWWNRNEHETSEEHEKCDDILVAVIQYADSDVSHLVGWSRRRCVMPAT